MNGIAKNLRALALWALPVAFLGVFFFYPLVSILGHSFARNQGNLAGPLTEVLSSPAERHVIWFTIGQAVLSTLLTLLLGLPGAYLLARYKLRGKSLIQALTAIPFVMPTLVVAAAFNALVGPSGWINLGLMALFNLDSPPIQFTGSLVAILVAHVFYNTTIVLRMVGDFWSHLDPRMEQAARVLGASRIRTWRHVTLPLLMPVIAAAALLVFIFDFTSFGVILVLGGPQFATLEVEIYYQTVSLLNLPLAAALSMVQLACTLVFTVVYTRLSARVSRPLTLRPGQFTQRRLVRPLGRWIASAYVVLLVGYLILPLVALALRSVTSIDRGRGQSTPIQRGLTLDFYKELAINRRASATYSPPARAISISLGYAFTTVALALILGTPAAYALARSDTVLVNRIFDPLLMLPLGTSAVTMGLGFIIALSQPPLDLRTSPILVPLAHTLVALPFVVRSLAPALRSIRPRLRQAASVLGANPAQIIRAIDLPLTGRAIIVAATFAFTISLGEFGATSLIVRPEYSTIPIVIYRFISRPGTLNYGQAMALSTILMMVCAVGMLAIERLRIAGIGEF